MTRDSPRNHDAAAIDHHTPNVAPRDDHHNHASSNHGHGGPYAYQPQPPGGQFYAGYPNQPQPHGYDGAHPPQPYPSPTNGQDPMYEGVPVQGYPLQYNGGYPQPPVVLVQETPQHRKSKKDDIIAIVIFIVGWFCCPVWCAGFCFISKKHQKTARIFGGLSVCCMVMNTIWIAIVIGFAIHNRRKCDEENDYSDNNRYNNNNRYNYRC